MMKVKLKSDTKGEWRELYEYVELDDFNFGGYDLKLSNGRILYEYAEKDTQEYEGELMWLRLSINGRYR